jgi:hypothetical protein
LLLGAVPELVRRSQAKADKGRAALKFTKPTITFPYKTKIRKFIHTIRYLMQGMNNPQIPEGSIHSAKEYKAIYGSYFKGLTNQELALEFNQKLGFASSISLFKDL